MSVGLVVLLVSLQPSGGDALGAGTVVWVLGTIVTLGLLGLGQRDRRALAARGAGRVVRHRRRHRLGLRRRHRQGDDRGAGRGRARRGAATWQSYLLIPVAPAAFLDAAVRAARRASARLPAGPDPGQPAARRRSGASGCWARRSTAARALLGGFVGAGLLTVGVFLLSRSPLLAAQEGGPRDTSGTSAGSRRRPALIRPAPASETLGVSPERVSRCSTGGNLPGVLGRQYRVRGPDAGRWGAGGRRAGPGRRLGVGVPDPPRLSPPLGLALRPTSRTIPSSSTSPTDPDELEEPERPRSSRRTARLRAGLALRRGLVLVPLPVALRLARAESVDAEASSEPSRRPARASLR